MAACCRTRGGSALFDLLLGGHTHGQPAVFAAGGLLLGLFVTGLVGSAAHCVGMCGPFVLAQSAARLRQLSAAQLTGFHRLSGGALVPYHLGRATTYVGLGAVSAALTERLSAVTGLRWIAPALLLAAAAMFLAQGLQRIGFVIGRRSGHEPAWSRRIGSLARPLFAAPTGMRGYLLGVLLGFLPCGLLYGAITAAAATADPLAGAAAMGAFVLGTVPALIAVGCLGHLVLRRSSKLAQNATAMVMVANAAILVLAALRWTA